jgi:hypothetical protein
MIFVMLNVLERDISGMRNEKFSFAKAYRATPKRDHKNISHHSISNKQ